MSLGSFEFGSSCSWSASLSSKYPTNISSSSLSSFGSGSLQSDTVIPPSVSSVSARFCPAYSNDSKQYSYDLSLTFALNVLGLIYARIALSLFAPLALTRLQNNKNMIGW